MTDASRRSLVIYLPDLSGGGAERLHIRLATDFMADGFDVTFLLDRHRGELLADVPPGAAVETLGADRQIKALPKLAAYLKRHRPDVLIANMEHMNIMAILARMLARVPTRIVATQHNAFSEQIKRPSWQFRALPALYRALMPRVDAIVAVSAGVADDLARCTGLDRASMTVIHNGVVTPDFAARAAGEPEHPWCLDGTPLVVGIGRFVAQKDFATLLDAFQSVPAPARLLLLGDGPLRTELEERVTHLRLSDRVSMPGFSANPLPTLRRADLFVLSSRFEGFGNVVAEALACGTPVVSTDCPHGPAEIVEDGRFGMLVPVGDPAALAAAIVSQLASVPDREALRRRGNQFTTAHCAAQYRRLIDRLTGRPSSVGIDMQGARA